MSDFSLLAIPNIEGMRFLRYIKVFGIVLFFWACLFLCIYFWITYRRKSKQMKQFHYFDQQTENLTKQLLLQKIHQSSGKAKLLLFIEYLEKFVTTRAYANIAELLALQWFTVHEIKELEATLYTDRQLSKDLEMKMDQKLLIN